jgi:hypothetical protein
VADVGFKQAMTLKLVRLEKGAEPRVHRTVRHTRTLSSCRCARPFACSRLTPSLPSRARR